MIVPSLIQLLLLALIVWFVASRRKSGRRAARRFAPDDTIPYPARQLDSGLSLNVLPSGSARDMERPLRWVVAALAVAILAVAAFEFVLRFASPMSGTLGLGYLAMLILAGVFLPALRLPTFGLGQPRGPDGTAPPGSGILTILLLAFLTNGAVHRALRELDYYVFDPRMPQDTADIVFAGLLLLTLVAVILRLLVERSET